MSRCPNVGIGPTSCIGALRSAWLNEFRRKRYKNGSHATFVFYMTGAAANTQDVCDEQLAAHRVPPQLMGILPSNAGGFGAVEPAARVFARNELEPLQSQFMAINEWAGVEVVKFAPYELARGGEGGA